MDLIQIVALTVLAAMLALVLKNQRPELALQLGIAAGALVLLLVSEQLVGVVDEIERIGEQFGLKSDQLLVVIKVVGMAYLAEFGVQICKDAGETSLAGKVELAGKVMIVAVSIPVIASLLSMIASIV
ncbi:MAG: stage III sporulation protein AD [Clostridiales bacterium]|jgi:stage III sporulation protein AD|nr:stage III sporulation protein AD [Clostridiales bacterium]